MSLYAIESNPQIDNQGNVSTIEIFNEGSDMEEKRKKLKNKPQDPVYKEHLTTLAHFCCLAYTILILYLCFIDEFVFFTWHPVLLSVGWMLLMTEGVLIISKNNVLQRNIGHDTKIYLHLILLSVGGCFAFIGVVVVFLNKNRLGKEHFKTWHGLFGLIALISTIPVFINGVLLYYKKELKNYLRGKVVKFVHVVTASFAVIFGGLCLFTSVYTKWFNKRTQGNEFIFYYGLVCVVTAVIWTLNKPLNVCIRFVKHQF